jgi:hypothetical protein
VSDLRKRNTGPGNGAPKRARLVLEWVPEFGDPVEIPIKQPCVHNGQDGRFVLTHRQVPAEQTSRLVRLEPDGALLRPHPYVVDGNGDVQDQGYWRGYPTALAGFQTRLDVNGVDVESVDLTCADWLAGDIQVAVGRYPVFVDGDGKRAVYQVAIRAVEVGQ